VENVLTCYIEKVATQILRRISKIILPSRREIHQLYNIVFGKLYSTRKCENSMLPTVLYLFHRPLKLNKKRKYFYSSNFLEIKLVAILLDNLLFKWKESFISRKLCLINEVVLVYFCFCELDRKINIRIERVEYIVILMAWVY
jgi:hypothetical protein